jgi:hypothetical protein
MHKRGCTPYILLKLVVQNLCINTWTQSLDFLIVTQRCFLKKYVSGNIIPEIIHREKQKDLCVPEAVHIFL